MNILLSFLYSIYFNFRYLDYKTAIKLPILIDWRTEIKSFNGSVEFDNPYFFCFRIGIGDVGFTRKKDSCLIKNNGKLIVSGRASIGRGSEICNDGVLTLGNKFNISASSRIICQNSISFGEGCLISWGCQIMDSDFHTIYKKNSVAKKSDIVISDRVWIGNSVYLYKGVTIGKGNIISSNSIVKKSFLSENCIIASNGNDIFLMKNDVKWEL